ncbi:MAG TPA: 6-hydroxymethylpterin diphosphokinase MptE-like protein [Anaerolineales bacterium]|nr:6-hydroxymethylpterin diphosphokinase MptE-like protein [Anaerolineales bacterium]
MKQTLKRTLPPSLWNLARDAYDGIRRIPELPAAYLHPWRRESIRRLTELKDIHKGRRAFVIGNGPSLRQTDLGKLKNEITFGLNRIYLLFPELGFSTTYLCVTNDLVVEQFVDDLRALPIPKFIAWRSRRHFPPHLPPDQLPTFLYTSYTGPRFARDVRGRVWEGATVTNVALQLAFHMGVQQVILIGVDHNFASRGEANKVVVSQGDDPNHFAPNYFGKGIKWQLPDLETSELGYTLAREAYRKAGREILDATIGGKLTIFPKVEYHSLFE